MQHYCICYTNLVYKTTMYIERCPLMAQTAHVVDGPILSYHWCMSLFIPLNLQTLFEHFFVEAVALLNIEFSVNQVALIFYHLLYKFLIFSHFVCSSWITHNIAKLHFHDALSRFFLILCVFFFIYWCCLCFIRFISNETNIFIVSKYWTFSDSQLTKCNKL